MGGLNPREEQEEGEENQIDSVGNTAFLQKQLSILQDCTAYRNLKEGLAQDGNWDQLKRLEELADPSVNHKWLWAVNTKVGSVMD